MIDSSKRYSDWTFFHSSEPRTEGAVSSWKHEEEAGLERMVGDVFANILTQSECDYFIGILGSNRMRLVNELRSTNGRLFSGFLALNIKEW